MLIVLLFYQTLQINLSHIVNLQHPPSQNVTALTTLKKNHLVFIRFSLFASDVYRSGSGN